MLLIVSYLAVPVIKSVVKMKFLILLSIFGDSFLLRVLMILGESIVSVKPMKDKFWTKAKFTFPLKNERSTRTSKQKADIRINKKKKKVSGLLKLFINHAALEVLTIFSKVSTCDYNAKTFIMKEC